MVVWNKVVNALSLGHLLIANTKGCEGIGIYITYLYSKFDTVLLVRVNCEVLSLNALPKEDIKISLPFL